MSNGRENAAMLCDDVKRVIYFFLDDSLGEQKRSSFEIHLINCPDCEIRVVIQRRLRGFLRKRLTPIAAPETLRVRVVQSLRAQ
jgi:mycothiol system anti-sigma-R factor